MAPHSSTLAWKTARTEEPGGLQSMESLGVGHDWATSLSLFTFMHWEGNGSPLQCSCLENRRDGRDWWTALYGVAQSRTRLKRLSSSSSSIYSDNLILNILSWNCDIELVNQMFTYSVSEKILQENVCIFYWLKMLKVSVAIKMFHHCNPFI